jgi:GntR family transcriptional regulator
MAKPLERNSWEPLYFQISEQLREKITGELSPGDRIPSENELISEYGVSRNTARLAIDTLIKQGLVYRVKGKGTYITSERLQYGLYQLVSFTEETLRRGMRPSSKVLRIQRIKAPPKIEQRMRLSSDQEVFLIERLRLANGKPMALNISYLPCHLCPNIDQEDLQNGSIYHIIENKYNLLIGYANQDLKPTIASDYEAELLKIKTGCALLLVEGIACLVDDTPIEYAKLLYRGDLFEFPIQAVRRPPIKES